MLEICIASPEIRKLKSMLEICMLKIRKLKFCMLKLVLEIRKLKSMLEICMLKFRMLKICPLKSMLKIPHTNETTSIHHKHFLCVVP